MSRRQRWSAAFLCAALVVFLASGWAYTASAQTSAPSAIRGTVQNGTKGADPRSTENLPVTLFQISPTGPVTLTNSTDVKGNFQFTDVITNATTFFARVDYAGIRYYSDILDPQLAATTLLSVTVYETQTLPAAFAIDPLHLIVTVQPQRLNVLALLQLTNLTDRAFYMPLPLPKGAGDVLFDDPRESTRLQREPDGTILYPILPTTTDIIYVAQTDVTPPNATLEVPLKTDVASFNLLVSMTGDTRVAGQDLTAGTPFVSQSGQQYFVFSAPGQTKGTVFRATLSNLPGLNNNLTQQAFILVAGAVGALALLGYPLYRRRVARAPAAAPSTREAQLEALARLDDAFDEGLLDRADYDVERAALKAELLSNVLKMNEGVRE